MSEQWHLTILSTLTDIKARRKGTLRSLLRHDGVVHTNSNLSDTSSGGGTDVAEMVKQSLEV